MVHFQHSVHNLMTIANKNFKNVMHFIGIAFWKKNEISQDFSLLIFLKSTSNENSAMETGMILTRWCYHKHKIFNFSFRNL